MILTHLWHDYRGRVDLYIVIPAVLLVIFGSLAVYSATEFPDSLRAGFFWRHILSLVVAGGAMLTMMALPLRALEDLAYVIYGAAVVLLLAVLVVGIEVYGARRWLGYGPIRMQPSEFAKVATCLVLARYLTARRRDPGRFTTLLIALGLTGLPMILVLKQPDLGTSGTFAMMAAGMLFWAGLPWLQVFLLASPFLSLITCRHYVLWGIYLAASAVALWRVRISWLLLGAFVLVQAAVLVGAPALWNRLEPYQKDRLMTFEHPESDPSGGGYQILQSKIAIGSGQLWGKGPLKGSQKALAFLPQQHTDFIFSVVGEETGFVGCFAAILLFVILILRGFHLGLHCRNPFSGGVATGISSLLLYHVGVNMAMTVGLLPVTGLPLPLISYGGSFLVSVFAMLGLLLNVSAHRFDY